MCERVTERESERERERERERESETFFPLSSPFTPTPLAVAARDFARGA